MSRSPKIIMYSELKEENGKTIRENNMEKDFEIPINTLVEVKVSNDIDSGSSGISGVVRAFVVQHHRDCDGEPLYRLDFYKSNHIEERVRILFTAKEDACEEEIQEAIKRAEIHGELFGFKLGSYSIDELKVVS